MTEHVEAISAASIQRVDNTPQVNRVVADINDTLSAPWTDSELKRGRSISTERIPWDLWPAVARRFRAQGWVCERHDDQRDGSWFSFKPERVEVQ